MKACHISSPYLYKRALSLCNNPRGEPHIFTKELHISTKEPYLSVITLVGYLSVIEIGLVTRLFHIWGLRALSLLQRDNPHEGYLSVIEIGLETRLFHILHDMTHSYVPYVWHDIWMSHVMYAFFIYYICYMTWLIHMCHMCDMTHFCQERNEWGAA